MGVPMDSVRGQESAEIESLLDALVSLRDTDEARLLLTDLCTPRELEDISQRLLVARMLDELGSES